ncbi:MULTISPECIES: YdaS family helix-turn-helix protein [unclassified Sphingomonas]|uniref:transcriptional regulator n=1 Tax=unclassified Sphingomonas TaxID=196159 RepID=UPI00286D2A3C|nr:MULTISPECIES: YdaS family helix-turn-helix protein [unclassified Sphingomonas]
MALEHRLESVFASAVQKAGSQSAFGRIIGKRQSVVHDWLRRGVPLPAEHVLKVEAATGISRYDLRPDIYPAPMDGSDAQA